MRQEEVLVAPGLVFGVPRRVVGVAGPLQRRVEQSGVRGLLAALDLQQRGEVGAAAEPADGGADEAGVHVHGRDPRGAQVGDQADAGGEEAAVGLCARHGLGELRRELAVHGGDVHPDLLEEAAVHHAHDAAAAGLARPRLKLEAARARAVERLRRLVLQLLEGGADAVAQGFEPGAGAALAGIEDVGGRGELAHRRAS